jgi:hypothetical protein
LLCFGRGGTPCVGAEGALEPLVGASREHRLVIVGAGIPMLAPTSLPSWWSFNESALAGRLAETTNREFSEERLAGLLSRRERLKSFTPDFMAQLMEEQAGLDYFRRSVEPPAQVGVVGAGGVEPPSSSVSANTGNRCATRRSPRSRPTVEAEGKRSLDVQGNALFRRSGPPRLGIGSVDRARQGRSRPGPSDLPRH